VTGPVPAPPAEEPAGTLRGAAHPRTIVARLPAFPWDSLGPARRLASEHAGGIVDLSIGTPVDPVPRSIQEALASAANSPGYPATSGTPAFRAAAAGWLARRHQVTVDPDAVLPVIGSKELIASLATMLGCGPGDTVVYPALAYPTYDLGARLAAARSVAADDPDAAGPGPVRLIWVNSPANPTGQVLPAGQLSKLARWARERGAILASDECYLELGWEEQPVSVLHPDACDGSPASLLAVHSLSKRSSLAGYRAGFVTGDPSLVAELREIRKHAGMMVPAPVIAAMTAALADDRHAEQQRARYAARRGTLRAALEQAGWAVEHSVAGLYLWVTHAQLDCWGSVQKLAEAGILVAPGELYGPSGSRHVRVALTATDERIHAAAARLAAMT
jgi:succinyldiaminopimelate transaminase